MIKYNDDGTTTMSYITTGGKIDVYFFLGGSAKDIIRRYQNLVGLPTLVPFWALGWHQASYGYKTKDQVDEMVQGYATAGIPLEGVWLDNHYMDKFKDFSVDATAFPDLVAYTTGLQAKGIKVAVNIDAGLSADDPEDTYYKQAQESKTLIQTGIEENKGKFNGALSSSTYPKNSVFLDFLADDSTLVWHNGLDDLFQKIPYDGVVLNMNEASAFCNGECPDGKPEPQSTLKEGKFLIDINNSLDTGMWYQTYP